MEKIYWADEAWGEWKWMRREFVKDLIFLTSVATGKSAPKLLSPHHIGLGIFEAESTLKS